MSCPKLIGVAFALFFGSFAFGQYTDYDWARGLSREYGFDDLAEKILSSMVSGPGRLPVEQQMGKLGLAELKASSARQNKDIEGKLALFDESRKLMQEVVGGISDKTSSEYQQALFAYVDLLQERGTAAIEAIAAGKVAEDKADEIRKNANADYARAEGELEKIRASMGEVSAEENREKWRLRNRAWYSLCLLQYNKALTHKKGGAQRGIELSRCKQTLEEFILANENDEDLESLLGALYGNLLMGQICQEQDEKNDALGYFTSVLDQISTEEKLGPAVQSLYERGLYHLFAYETTLGNFESILKRGKEVEAFYKKFSSEYGLYGRAARVSVANARLKSNDMNGALAIAAEVAESGNNDASSQLANQLIADILTSSPDKTQFAPEIIASAARGAFSQGKEKRAEAVRYYQILLEILAKVADEDERNALGAESWYRIASTHYLEDRYLEAAAAYREGSLKYWTVKKDSLGDNLVSYWGRSLKQADQVKSSPEIKAMIKEHQDFIIVKGVTGTKGKGAIIFEQADDLARQAAEMERAKNLAGAIGLYGQAAAKYRESSQVGGPDKEKALIKAARVGLKIAKVHMGAKELDKALPLITSAKTEFEQYLKYILDDANKLTDPSLISARGAAKAEARYNIAECNRNLAENEKDAAKKAELFAASVALLAGYEKEHANQKSLVEFALSERLASNIDVGNIGAAEADLALLKAQGVKAAVLARGWLMIGKALKDPAEKALDAVTGKARPTDAAEWASVIAKPEFAAAQTQWRRICDFYRGWLLTNDSEKFADWDAVTFMYWRAGLMDGATPLLAKALEKFNTSKTKPEDLQKLQNRALVAFVTMAQEADAAGNADVAGRLWNDAGRSVEALLATEAGKKSATITRLAAIVYGGYVGRYQGLPKQYTALGKPEKAVALWGELLKTASATQDSGLWWESKFYSMLAELQRQKSTAKADLKQLREVMKSLEATKPDMGGEGWKPLFEWMKRQL